MALREREKIILGEINQIIWEIRDGLQHRKVGIAPDLKHYVDHRLIIDHLKSIKLQIDLRTEKNSKVYWYHNNRFVFHNVIINYSYLKLI